MTIPTLKPITIQCLLVFMLLSVFEIPVGMRSDFCYAEEQVGVRSPRDTNNAYDFLTMFYDPELKTERVLIFRKMGGNIKLMDSFALEGISPESRSLRYVSSKGELVYVTTEKDKFKDKINADFIKLNLNKKTAKRSEIFTDLPQGEEFQCYLAQSIFYFFYSPFENSSLFINRGASNVIYYQQMDLRPKTLIHWSKSCLGAPFSALFSPDGKYIVFASYFPFRADDKNETPEKGIGFVVGLLPFDPPIEENDIKDFDKLLQVIQNADTKEAKFLISGFTDHEKMIISKFKGNQVDLYVKLKALKGINRSIKIEQKEFAFNEIFYTLGNGKYAVKAKNMELLSKLFPDIFYEINRFSVKTKQIFTSYKSLDSGNIHEPIIPHLCWSPNSDRILFVGASERNWNTNVYMIDIKTGKYEKMLEKDDTTRLFNPDLEWTGNGIVITGKDEIFIRDVPAMPASKGKTTRVPIDGFITSMKNGRISPDGKTLAFIGRKNGVFSLFMYDFADKTSAAYETGTDFVPDNYQGGWITPGKDSIINNQVERCDDIFSLKPQSPH